MVKEYSILSVVFVCLFWCGTWTLFWPLPAFWVQAHSLTS